MLTSKACPVPKVTGEARVILTALFVSSKREGSVLAPTATTTVVGSAPSATAKTVVISFRVPWRTSMRSVCPLSPQRWLKSRQPSAAVKNERWSSGCHTGAKPISPAGPS